MTTVAELSAQFTGLSGRVDDLSGRVLDNEKIIIGLPDKGDFSNLTQSQASQFNSLDSRLDVLEEKVNDLAAYIINLKLDVSSLTADFTGHTGDASVHV